MARVKVVRSSSYGRIMIGTTDDKLILYSLKDICKLFSINYQKVRKELPSNEIFEIEVIVNVRRSKHIFIKRSALDTCLRLSEEAKADEIYEWLISIKEKTELYVNNYSVDDLKDDDKAYKFLKRYIELETSISVLENRVEEDLPKVEFANSLYGSKALIDLHLIHRKIKFRGMQLYTVLEHLRNAGILDDNNKPYQKYIDKKNFRLVTVLTHIKDEQVKRSKTLVYKSGIRLIESVIEKAAGVKK